MKLIKNKNFELGINWYKYKLHWKPTYVGHLDSFHKHNNGKGFKFTNTWSYYVPTMIQCFWLKFIIYIKIKPKLISGKKPIKYVRFDKTHLSMMDLPEGNWDD